MENNRLIKPRRTRKARFFTVFLALAVLLLIRELGGGSMSTGAVLSAQDTSTPAPTAITNEYLTIKSAALKPPVYAKNYALIDGSNGDVLVGQGYDDLIPVASTTKMVTALVVVNHMTLNKIVTIGKRPPSVAGSKINLLAGEKISIENLLKALLINSGNDAAFALAEAYSGKEGEYQPFVDQMNAFVRRHNMRKSTFFDPAGLDDERGRSTARELAHIARLVIAHDTLRGIIMTPQTEVRSVDGQTVHPLKNTNRLIQADTQYYLPNALGVKTGFTHDAGHCLVAAYQWNNKTLIGVVMNTVEYTNTASANEMKKLFLWADTNLISQKYLH